MATALTVTKDKGSRPEVTILRLHGPLLIGNVPVFLHAAYETEAPVMIVDFADVSYMDSAGLGAVLQVYRHQQTHGRKLAVAALNQRVHALMQLTRTNQIVAVCATVADAEKA
jgi:anti-sigma B factor antagonist